MWFRDFCMRHYEDLGIGNKVLARIFFGPRGWDEYVEKIKGFDENRPYQGRGNSSDLSVLLTPKSRDSS